MRTLYFILWMIPLALGCESDEKATTDTQLDADADADAGRAAAEAMGLLSELAYSRLQVYSTYWAE